MSDNNALSNYRNGLKEHIPAGLYSAYVTIEGASSAIPNDTARLVMLWSAFALILAAVVVWSVWFDSTRAHDGAGRKWMKVIFGVVSFTVLVMCVGGPFTASALEGGATQETVDTIKTIGGVVALLLTLAIFPVVLGFFSKRPEPAIP